MKSGLFVFQPPLSYGKLNKIVADATTLNTLGSAVWIFPTPERNIPLIGVGNGRYPTVFTVR